MLAPFAEGHTVKSIARLTGRTPASINERLRDARRKTGAASSRELARAVRHNKLVPNKIGVDAAPSRAAAEPRKHLWRHPGVLFGGSAVIAILALVLAMPPAPQQRPAVPAASATARQYDLRAALFRHGQALVRPVLRAAAGASS